MTPQKPSVVEEPLHPPSNNDQSGSDGTNNETIWFKEEERWELTWPIWGMLPRDERKALANKYGYKTIGDFEEFMTLNRAVGDTSEVRTPYKNEVLYDAATVANAEEPDSKLPAVPRKKEEQDEESDNESDEEDALDSSDDSVLEELSDNELLQRAGQILILPEELLHCVFEWLPIDMYASMARVSPHWRHFTRTEAVYKRLCERIYLQTSKRRSLNVARFGHSYRTMLRDRPRVIVGGGLYVLKYTSVKKIQRDMWTEIPVGAVLETVYYRYLYFQENGTVLYALTPSPPHEMLPRFKKVNLFGESDKQAVWGTYQVQKDKVTVTARQEWHTVRMEMTILPDYPGHGRFGSLTFDKHLSSFSGSFNRQVASDIVEYKVPGSVFRFLKDHRM